MRLFRFFDYNNLKSIDGVIHIEEIRFIDKNRTVEKRLNNSLKLRIKVKNAETVLPELISKITEDRPNNIETIRIEKPNLESIFLELTGKRFEEVEGNFSNKNRS